MEDSFGDIIAFVESNYRVKKNRANRAIAGLSMGACTLRLSAQYTKTFDYVGIFPTTHLYHEGRQQRRGGTG